MQTERGRIDWSEALFIVLVTLVVCALIILLGVTLTDAASITAKAYKVRFGKYVYRCDAVEVSREGQIAVAALGGCWGIEGPVTIYGEFVVERVGARP